jgi:hypothetical protein
MLICVFSYFLINSANQSITITLNYVIVVVDNQYVSGGLVDL